jgi:hypothetical protein
MLAAHAAIVVFGVIPKVLFRRIFRSEVSLTLDAEVVCITAFKMFVPFLSEEKSRLHLTQKW